MAPPGITIDSAADSKSCQSLSFSGLLSVQDMQSKALSVNPNSASAQVQLQALLYQSTQVNHKPGSKGEANSNNQSLKYGNKDGTRVSSKPNHKERNQAKMEHTASNKSFGQKIFLSFVSPCRECRAHQPGIKEPSVAGIKSQTLKSY
ncbi:hypothetical protein M5689_008848 [Euphorbia peplus]|nr:hypothetical protein M5689_008848 [Euphorbia peplus]